MQSRRSTLTENIWPPRFMSASRGLSRDDGARSPGGPQLRLLGARIGRWVRSARPRWKASSRNSRPTVPALWILSSAVQHRFGHVSDDAVQAIAAGLGIHAVEIEDMVSFYAFFNREPRGRFRIRLSKTPISFIKGAKEVARAFEETLGLSLGETSADGAFTLEWTSDIGMADQEPAALINGMILTALTPGDAPQIVAALRQRGHDGDPLPYPPHAAQGATLPKATVRSSLVQPGPLLSGLPGRGDGIKAALARPPEKVIEEITNAKLRGRGGAGFPTGMKWRFTRKATGEDHYVVCNADEGEPGTFKDRVLLSEFPDLVFDGMTIAGYALGSRHGLVYLRGEYAYLWDALQDVLKNRRRLGLLGANICGREGFDFDIRIQLGAGAYICGEESALLESLEGKRGAPRDRPPFPTERGYLHQPTAIDNVETFVCAARIMEKGRRLVLRVSARRNSTGTKLMSVSGDCTHPGVYEVPFGITVNELLDLVGAPDAEYVQMSGPSGQVRRAEGFRPAHRLRGSVDRRLDHDLRSATRRARYRACNSPISSSTSPAAGARRAGLAPLCSSRGWRKSSPAARRLRISPRLKPLRTPSSG